MGRIEKEIKVCGTKKCRVIKAFFDTGSDVAWISPSVANEIGVEETGFESEIILADKGRMKGKEVEVKEIIVEGYRRPKPRVLVGNIPKDMIVGNRFMQEAGITLDLKKEQLKFGKPDLLLI